jgi:hypothetical protein
MWAAGGGNETDTSTGDGGYEDERGYDCGRVITRGNDSEWRPDMGACVGEGRRMNSGSARAKSGEARVEASSDLRIERAGESEASELDLARAGDACMPEAPSEEDGRGRRESSTSRSATSQFVAMLSSAAVRWRSFIRQNDYGRHNEHNADARQKPAYPLRPED